MCLRVFVSFFLQKQKHTFAFREKAKTDGDLHVWLLASYLPINTQQEKVQSEMVQKLNNFQISWLKSRWNWMNQMAFNVFLALFDKFESRFGCKILIMIVTGNFE